MENNNCSENTLEQQSCHKDLQFDHNKEFDIMVIEPNNIEHLDYNNPGYIVNLINQSYVKTIKTNSDTFVSKIAEYLKVNNFSEIDRNIVTHVVYHKPDYFYEILHLDVKDNKNMTTENENQFSSMISTQNEKVWGNMIILKTYNPSNNDKKMSMDTMMKDDLFDILDSRVNTKVVVFEDGEYRLETVRGDMDIYCKNLFDGEFYKKKEILFLNHNINIWYLENEYGTEAFPKLVPGKIETAVIFSMISEEYRGNITLDEVKKIVSLSKVMNDFGLKSEWVSEEKDEMNRNIIKNKYRVLEYAWNEYINKIV